MLIFLMILAFTQVLFGHHMGFMFSEIAAPIHQACSAAAPASDQAPYYRAMICASHLPNNAERTQSAAVGLFHLVILSGTHLLFLEAITRKFMRQGRFAGVLVWPILLAFVLMSGFEARVVRALLSIFIRRTCQLWQLRWSNVQVVTATGAATLLLFRESGSVQSILMSWIASLAIFGFSLPFDTDQENATLRRFILHLKLYVFLIPALLPYSLPHPLSILTSFILAPSFAVVLFPVSLFAFAVPYLSNFTDWIWLAAHSLISEIASGIPSGLQACRVPTGALALYLLVLTVCAWHNEGHPA